MVRVKFSLNLAIRLSYFKRLILHGQWPKIYQQVKQKKVVFKSSRTLHGKLGTKLSRIFVRRNCAIFITTRTKTIITVSAHTAMGQYESTIILDQTVNPVLKIVFHLQDWIDPTTITIDISKTTFSFLKEEITLCCSPSCDF